MTRNTTTTPASRRGVHVIAAGELNELRADVPAVLFQHSDGMTVLALRDGLVVDTKIAASIEELFAALAAPQSLSLG